MTPTITTLALNLLISERINHRSVFASKIVELLDTVIDKTEKEKQIKHDFKAVISQCVENPTCQFRDLFYHYAQYYGTKIVSREPMSSAA